jgi:hypothetical protein
MVSLPTLIGVFPGLMLCLQSQGHTYSAFFEFKVNVFRSECTVFWTYLVLKLSPAAEKSFIEDYSGLICLLGVFVSLINI